MIGILFEFVGDIIEVRVDCTNVLFRKKDFGGAFATIDNLKLSKTGVVKEFPDLKENKNWKEIAIERFKEKIKGLNTEEERKEYIINDLIKFGYKPLYEQKSGFRIKKI